jgi:hypothetical protein
VAVFPIGEKNTDVGFKVNAACDNVTVVPVIFVKNVPSGNEFDVVKFDA